MRMFYLFRVFVQDQSDCDNDEDQWLSFDSVSVVADFTPSHSDILQYKDREGLARSELKKIATHKTFRAVVDKNASVDTLRALFMLQQQELIVATDIELYKYDDTQGKDAATLLSSMSFNSTITRHSIDSSRNYDFRFQIVGDVDLGDAPDMSETPEMVKKATQVGRSQPSADNGGALAAAFADIEPSAARGEGVDRRSQSLGSLLTVSWREAASVRMRFWVEAGLAALSCFLGLLTLFSREWIEALTGFDPDNKDGSFEWAIVAALFLVCVLSSLIARADRRRLNSFAQAGI